MVVTTVEVDAIFLEIKHDIICRKRFSLEPVVQWMLQVDVLGIVNPFMRAYSLEYSQTVSGDYNPNSMHTGCWCLFACVDATFQMEEQIQS